MVIADNKTFKTSDTALAAYLVSEGFGTPDIEYNDGSRAFFLFKKSPKIYGFVRAWDTIKAQGNVVMFFQAYQSLLRRIHHDKY